MPTPAPVPVQPVPVALSVARAERSQISLWDRIVAFFTGSDVSEPAPIVVPTTRANPRSARGDHAQGERRRGRGNGDGRRDGRRDVRRDGKPDERRDGKREGDARQGEHEARRDTKRQDERRPGASKPDAKPRREQQPSQDVAPTKQSRSANRARVLRRKNRSCQSQRAVTMPEDIGPSPSIAAGGSLVTADLVAAEAPRGEGAGRSGP